MELGVMDDNVDIIPEGQNGLDLSWARTYFRKTMEHADKLFLVNSPTHFRKPTQATEIQQFEMAIKGEGLFTYFSSETDMIKASEHFCLVARNHACIIPQLKYICICKFFHNELHCTASTLIRDLDGCFNQQLHEAYIAPANKQRLTRYVPNFIQGRSESSQVPRGILSYYVSKRGKQ
jgi:hypothetical protein